VQVLGGVSIRIWYEFGAKQENDRYSRLRPELCNTDYTGSTESRNVSNHTTRYNFKDDIKVHGLHTDKTVSLAADLLAIFSSWP
jgi:hypothetical protein